MQTIREEDIINRPSDNQALTDSCGDDKSFDGNEMMHKLDSESFPKFESGIRPSTNTATIENVTDPGTAGSIVIPSVPQSEQHSCKNFP